MLVHKKGNRAELSNWRPIAMGDVATKVFAAMLADHLSRWARVNNRLSSTQKGFLPHEGYLEHSFMLQRLIEDTRNKKNEVAIAWLDLADVFGLVPHAVIKSTFAVAFVPAKVVDTIMSLYEALTVRVREIHRSYPHALKLSLIHI